VAVGLTTAGILGALLAPPVAASFRVIGSYVHAKLLDYPAFGGRLLTDPPPRSYRRKVSGRELEARRNQEKADEPDRKTPPATETLSRDGAPQPPTSQLSGSPNAGSPTNGAHFDAKQSIAEQES